MSYNWLTERDKEVYEYLCNNTRYVSTSQLAELFFRERMKDKKPISDPKKICRRRMSEIEKNLPGVQSFFRQANTDKIYTILPPKENIAAISRIEHSLRLNDLYIQIRKYAKEHGDKIYDFKIEPQIKGDIIPDILLIYQKGNKGRIFFIEYDRNTEAINKIKKKLERYDAYMMKQLYLSEDWQPSENGIKPSVVFICDNTARAERIRKLGATAYNDVTEILKY